MTGVQTCALPISGDQWYDTVNDTLYEYVDDGTGRFWLDMTGKAVPVTYSSGTTAPTAPKAGDQWYDTGAGVLYTRVYDGASSYWVDYSSQAPANTINSSTIIVQPQFGGTGVTSIEGLVKGNGTNPFSVAVPGVDYFAVAANGVAVNSAFAADDINVGDTITAGTVTTNAQPNITSTGVLTSLNVTGNIISGNVKLNGAIISNLANVDWYNDRTGIKIVTNPNNPDGEVTDPSSATILDLCYNWPQYTDVVKYDHPIMVFSLLLQLLTIFI